MRTMRSSWNSDRVAAAFLTRRAPKRTAPRHSKLYAEYKIGSDTISVFTRRGRKVFTRHFGDTILSACVSGDQLWVETANGGRFVCDAWTGKPLESEAPLEPAICAGILDAA